MISDVTPFIMTEYFSATMSSQPQRRGLPVVAPEFHANLAHPLAVFVEKFGRERSAAHPRAIGLEDAVHVADARRSYAQTGTNAGAERVRRRDEGISAEIDVQHRTLRSFGQHRVILVEQAVHRMLAVDQPETLEILDSLEPLLLVVGQVDRIVVLAEQSEVFFLQPPYRSPNSGDTISPILSPLRPVLSI